MKRSPTKVVHARTRREPREAKEPGFVTALAGRSGYFGWSRDPAVALLGVLPLWLLYEILRLFLAPSERNGAEALVTDSLQLLGAHALLVLRIVLGAVVVAAAVSVLRRRLPWARIAAVAALEGSIYGLMLGQVTMIVTRFVLEGVALARGQGSGSSVDASDFVGSLGAGLFEEAVFRLVLLSLLALAFTRACEAFSMPRAIGVIGAVIVSAVAFAAFHHIGVGGDPYVPGVFVFRAVAGVALGLLFVSRGFCVVVYTHAIYDVHYYLSHG